MRYHFTDDTWAAFEPLARRATGVRRGARPKLSERMFFEALFYVARTGIPWRDLPAEFGCWLSVYQRFRRWLAGGRLDRLFDLLTADPTFGPTRRVFVDSTVVRAHQHAAGGRRKKSGSAASGRRRPRRSAAAAAA